jgi:hypothetical protein
MARAEAGIDLSQHDKGLLCLANLPAIRKDAIATVFAISAMD